MLTEAEFYERRGKRVKVRSVLGFLALVLTVAFPPFFVVLAAMVGCWIGTLRRERAAAVALQPRLDDRLRSAEDQAWGRIARGGR